MAAIASLCVFCGSQTGRNPAYAAVARSLGAALAQRRITLVYGAGGIGLMGVVADAVLAGGGKAIGVIPEKLESLEVAHPGLTETVVTKDMFRRKRIMLDRADGFVILPGGYGTLDEFFEVLTWKQLGLLDKPIVVLDSEGYWGPLLDLLDQVSAEGFAPPATSGLATVVNSIDELFIALDNGEA
ncbi:MAG: TIGR00730 family Rossman fold protein [Rhodospirillaceae bacterium]|nr:TIGR00730 family Rossman fold protein [Rhodospirillaceae bacterium]